MLCVVRLVMMFMMNSFFRFGSLNKKKSTNTCTIKKKKKSIRIIALNNRDAVYLADDCTVPYKDVLSPVRNNHSKILTFRQ